jgi:hypothetical protein
MTARRDLGPILALTGAGIALAAVIAGFIVTGGPGDARDRRLDEMTEHNLTAVLSVVQCAFNGSGVAPASFDSALRTYGWTSEPAKSSICTHWRGSDLTVPNGGNPARPGEMTYDAISPTRIRVCAFYQRSSEARECNGCYKDSSYDSVFAARSAGLNCYDIDMIAQPTLDMSPALEGGFRISH